MEALTPGRGVEGSLESDRGVVTLGPGDGDCLETAPGLTGPHLETDRSHQFSGVPRQAHLELRVEPAAGDCKLPELGVWLLGGVVV